MCRARPLVRPWAPVMVLLFTLATAATAVEIPELWGRVMDNAGMLSSATVQQLEDRLTRLEQDTGAQVVVLTVDSLEGLPVEDYSLRAVEQWQLGRKDVDDGLLVLVAKQDRKMRIEVGYGLEGTLPDAAAGRIISELMVPYFRQGNFDAGVEAAVATIDAKIRGEEATIQPPPQASSGGGGQSDGDGPFFVFLMMLFGGIPMMRDAVLAKKSSAWASYVFILFLALVLYAALQLTLLLVIAGLWLILFPILRRMIPEATRKKMRKARRRHRRSTYIGGGGFSGGGFSGGGFSGGGGSFGGGGASGSW